MEIATKMNAASTANFACACFLRITKYNQQEKTKTASKHAIEDTAPTIHFHITNLRCRKKAPAATSFLL